MGGDKDSEDTNSTMKTSPITFFYYLSTLAFICILYTIHVNRPCVSYIHVPATDSIIGDAGETWQDASTTEKRTERDTADQDELIRPHVEGEYRRKEGGFVPDIESGGPPEALSELSPSGGAEGGSEGPSEDTSNANTELLFGRVEMQELFKPAADPISRAQVSSTESSVSWPSAVTLTPSSKSATSTEQPPSNLAGGAGDDNVVVDDGEHEDELNDDVDELDFDVPDVDDDTMYDTNEDESYDIHVGPQASEDNDDGDEELGSTTEPPTTTTAAAAAAGSIRAKATKRTPTPPRKQTSRGRLAGTSTQGPPGQQAQQNNPKQRGTTQKAGLRAPPPAAQKPLPVVAKGKLVPGATTKKVPIPPNTYVEKESQSKGLSAQQQQPADAPNTQVPVLNAQILNNGSRGQIASKVISIIRQNDEDSRVSEIPPESRAMSDLVGSTTEAIASYSSPSASLSVSYESPSAISSYMDSILNNVSSSDLSYYYSVSDPTAGNETVLEEGEEEQIEGHYTLSSVAPDELPWADDSLVDSEEEDEEGGEALADYPESESYSIVSFVTKSSSLVAAATDELGTTSTTTVYPLSTTLLPENEFGLGFINHRAWRKALKKHSSAEKLIVLAFTDSSFIPMALNFYETSIARFDIDNFLFVTTDDRACEMLGELNIACHVYMHVHGVDGDIKALYGTDEFNRKMKARTLLILDALLMGYSVLHSDVDIVWQQNALEDIVCDPAVDCDITSLWDSVMWNAGFFLIRPTSASIDLYKRMKVMILNTNMREQQIMNAALQQMGQHIRLKGLSEAKYLSGVNYFQRGRRMFAGDNPCTECIVIHNNWIVSEQTKRYRFKEHHLWMYNGDDYYSDPDRKYLAYQNPITFSSKDETLEREYEALVNAFAIGHILNRTVILPRFHCSSSLHDECSLMVMYELVGIDWQFGDLYRESTFLTHPKVPESVKSSLSETYFIATQASMKTMVQSSATLPYGRTIMQASEFKDGADFNDIIRWFEGISESVLRFHSLYSVFVDV